MKPVPPPIANNSSSAATTAPTRNRMVKLLLENIGLNLTQASNGCGKLAAKGKDRGKWRARDGGTAPTYYYLVDGDHRGDRDHRGDACPGDGSDAISAARRASSSGVRPAVSPLRKLRRRACSHSVMPPPIRSSGVSSQSSK